MERVDLRKDLTPRPGVKGHRFKSGRPDQLRGHIIDGYALFSCLGDYLGDNVVGGARRRRKTRLRHARRLMVT